MSKNDEGKEPPPKRVADLEGFEEPEDWDLPPVITEEDDSPEILEVIEAEKAIETIFANIHITTIISTILGLLLGIAFLVVERVLPAHEYLLIKMAIGFAAGVFFMMMLISGEKKKWNTTYINLDERQGNLTGEIKVGRRIREKTLC